MSAKIVAPFDTVDDWQAAEAFSELGLRMNDFKAESLALDGPFPPEPAYLTAIVSAYREDSLGESNVLRKLIYISDDPAVRLRSADIFLAAYREHIVPLLEVGDTLEKHAPSYLGRLALRSTEIAQSVQLRTVGAFVLYCDQETGNNYTALMIPKKIFTDLPLEDREGWLSQIKNLRDSGDDLKNLSQEIQDFLRDVRQNNPVRGRVAYLAAASHLPSMSHMEQETREILKDDQPGQKPLTVSRQQRRAQERAALKRKRKI